ncbi:MAG: GntR family transcriptional regulator [Microbacteriaceae bacterium]|nr:GntR family transcriptional regulator [Microbacteriaceae bacterium]
MISVGDQGHDALLQGELTTMLGQEPVVVHSTGGRATTAPMRAYDLLRALIRKGTLDVDSQLDEVEIVNSLSISRTAVRLALGALDERGAVRRRQRAGTIVTSRPYRVESNLILSQDPALPPPMLEHRFFSDRIEHPPQAVAAQLDFPSGKMRVMTDAIVVEGETIGIRVVYEDSATPPMDKSFHGMARKRGRDALAVIFLQRMGSELGAITTHVEAVPCETRTARLLGIPAKSPVLLREQLVRDASGKARLLSQAYYRADRCTIAADIDAGSRRA